MSLTEVEGLSDLLDAETILQLKISQQNTSVLYILFDKFSKLD
jgi:tRNA modification GTPase